MELNTLLDVLVHELDDLYSAEDQVLKALPKMAKAASSDKLRNGFRNHFSQTKEHVKRLTSVASILDQTLGKEKCKGMEGLLKEGEELITKEKGAALDAALISSAQRVEHYEIAGYGSAITFAKLIGYTDIAKILEETIKEEEEETDKLLTKIAEKEVNEKASEEI